MFRLNVPTKRGVVLNGVLFRTEEKRTVDTVMIAITGIHGNFYSNPFYYNIGDTLNLGGIDFIYAQTNDTFGRIRTINVNTGKEELIGSWNERFFIPTRTLKPIWTLPSRKAMRISSSQGTPWAQTR